MSQVQIQRNLVRKRWREEEERFPIPSQEFEGPIPCLLYPGFFYIPWVDTRVVINHAGEMIRLLTGKSHPWHYNHKGYHRTSLRIGESYQSTAVHRIVGMLFCAIPERHAGKSFDELEINHKDGDIDNNHYLNLEWVTGVENMRHAWASGLILTEIPVLTRDVESGLITSYPSISECARLHHLDTAALSKHVNSRYAGMIIRDNHCFKLADDSAWPTELAVRDTSIRIGMNCDCVGENVESGERLVFSSLIQAAEYLQLPITPLRLSRTRKGLEVPYCGWIFYSLSGLPLSKKFKGDRYHTLLK